MNPIIEAHIEIRPDDDGGYLVRFQPAGQMFANVYVPSKYLIEETLRLMAGSYARYLTRQLPNV